MTRKTKFTSSSVKIDVQRICPSRFNYIFFFTGILQWFCEQRLGTRTTILKICVLRTSEKLKDIRFICKILSISVSTGKTIGKRQFLLIGTRIFFNYETDWNDWDRNLRRTVIRVRISNKRRICRQRIHMFLDLQRLVFKSLYLL